MPAAIWPLCAPFVCAFRACPVHVCRSLVGLSRSAMPMSRAIINAKRSERRRKLSARLALAEPSAGVPRSEEQAAKKVKPTRAAYLVEAKAEPETSEEHEDASAWLEKGRLSKMARGKSSECTRRPARLRTAEEASRARTKSKHQGAPWRSSGAGGLEGCPLDGGRDVVPRWKVEGELQRAQRGQRGCQPSATLLSKAAAQLLRWGRSDIVKTIRLQGWTPGAWVAVTELAKAMGVRAEQLPAEVLQSMGGHGPRVEYQQREGGQEPLVRACWTTDREEKP